MNKYISLTALMIAAAVTLTGCDVTTPKNDTKTNNTQAEQAKEITATIYLPDKDFLQIEPKEITVPLTKNKEKTILEELIKADQAEAYPIFPKNVSILNVTIDKNVATINFSKELLHMAKGSTTEDLFIAMVTNTLTESKEIHSVKFLVDGKEINRLTGHHDMTKEFQRNTEIIKK